VCAKDVTTQLHILADYAMIVGMIKVGGNNIAKEAGYD